MDAPRDCRAKYYVNDGDICESPWLRDDNGGAASGIIETTNGERIPFDLFHAYTSVEGFAAYRHDEDGEKTILINRAHIQRILIS